MVRLRGMGLARAGREEARNRHDDCACSLEFEYLTDFEGSVEMFTITNHREVGVVQCASATRSDVQEQAAGWAG